MKTTPILFSAPMIRALLENRKTQTRRFRYREKQVLLSRGLGPQEPTTIDIHTAWSKMHGRFQKAGPGHRELLWVRETWHPVIEGHPVVLYKVDNQIVYHDTGRQDQNIIYEQPERWVSSIHMPRWASRLTLEVTATKVERLHDMSQDDARAEGIAVLCEPHGIYTRKMLEVGPISLFQEIWENIHGLGAWPANPEVVALTFRVHTANVDQVLEKSAA